MDALYLRSIVRVFEYTITFSYDTTRNNHKTRTCVVQSTNEDEARFWFYRFIDSNNEKKCKAYSNVQILEIKQTKINNYYLNGQGEVELAHL